MPQQGRHRGSNLQAIYFVTLLALLSAFSYIDRYILNVMVESIKRDFQVSDTQISLLIGFSFSLFYAAFGLPIARLADRSARKPILAGGVALWSLMTSLSGVAVSYWQLFLARFGVGIGEAALAPTAYSMMADRFSPRHLGRAVSVFVIGGTIGTAVAYGAGGFLLTWADRTWPDGVPIAVVGSIYSWQLVFLLFGLPGLILAAVLLLTIREPARIGTQNKADEVKLSALIAFMRENRRLFIAMLIGISVTQLGTGALTTWVPALMERKYGLAPNQATVYLAASFIFPTLIAVLGSGALADGLIRRGIHDAHLRICAIGTALGIVPMGMAPLMPTPGLYALLAGIGTLCAFVSVPMIPTAIQLVTPNRMRATLTTVHNFILTLVAGGLAPLCAALLTDYVFRGDQYLDRSLSLMLFCAFIGSSILFATGMKPLAAKMRTVSMT